MTYDRHNGRSDRVRKYLVKHPGPGLRQLIDAVEPGCARNNMAATVSTLVKRGKARTEGRRGATRYYPTPTTLVDERAAANAATGVKRRKPRRRTRVTETPSRAASRPLAAKPAARAPLPRLMRTDPQLAPRKGAAGETVDQYLARGGRIDVLPRGAVSCPLRYDHST